jgi:hypothetical protein
MAAALIDRNGKEPRPQAALAAKLPQPEKRRDENFLDDVVHVPRPTEQTIRQGRNLGRMLLHDPAERRILAPAERLHQGLFLGHLRHG